MADTGGADIPASDATTRQNDTGEEPHIESSQPACAPRSHRPCTDCGYKQEDWTRSVEFVRTDHSGNETIVVGRALFDTGNKFDNCLSLDFVKRGNIQFEHSVNVKGTRLSLWQHIWFKILGKRSQATCYTADQRPIRVVGVVENLRWRGIDEARCTGGLHFPQKFLPSCFRVVENLSHDAIFSCRTMNDMQLRGACHYEIAAIELPKPTQDSSAVKKSKDAKEEQRTIRQNLEQGRSLQGTGNPTANR